MLVTTVILFRCSTTCAGLHVVEKIFGREWWEVIIDGCQLSNRLFMHSLHENG